MNFIIKKYKFYLAIAAPGIHKIETSTKVQIRKIAHTGQGCLIDSPFCGTQASYPEPSTAISTKLATNMEIIARGDKYFQHISQYNPGLEPVIISISSANLRN